MFTLTLYGPSGIELAKIESLPGETLAAALLRAWAGVVGDDEPRMLLPGREFEQADDAPGTGSGLAHIVRQSDPEARTHPVEHVRFDTDPPQF